MNARLLLLAILLHLNLVLVRANYNLSITLNSYTNVNNLCVECVDGGIGCCDDFTRRICTNSNRGSRCETYFEYCLLPLNTVASNGPVPCTARAQSNPATDDSSINFAQSTVLGLSNPLVLREPSSAWNGIQLQVTATDDDSNGNDDTNGNSNDDSDSDSDSDSNNNNNNNPSGVDDLIDFFQLNINSGDTSGSLNLNGFHGIAQMSLSYLVDLDNCVGIDCSGRGRCIDGQNSYTCVCNSGFTGTNCETNINDCAGVTCGGRGTCVDSVNSFTCSCDLGFTGALCQTNIDDCTGIDCSGNGQCMDGVNSYTCTCDTGFTGANCDITIVNCNGVACSGKGQCVEGMNNYTCSCDTGFTGMLCETNIDDCVGVDCSGNGRCVDDVGTSTCVCDSDYTGDSCQFQIQQDSCSGMNCSDLGVNDGIESGLDYITLVFIIGGTLGGVLVLLIMIACVLTIVLSTSSRTKQGTEPPPKRQSWDMADNINYNGPSNFRGENDEAIYDEITPRAVGTVVGSRRHGLYAFNNEEMNGMESYSVYDVVL